MSNHTPGPWEWEHHPDRLVGINGDDVLCGCVGGFGSDHPGNWAVLEMAPELLAVCKAIAGEDMPTYGQAGHITLNDAVKMAHEVIAKIKNKTNNRNAQ